jgi:hypothetical protein
MAILDQKKARKYGLIVKTHKENRYYNNSGYS